MTRQLCFTLALCGALTAQVASAQISDDFESDSSGSYTVLDESNAASGDGTPDGNILFAFDYTALSVPAAPNSAPGATSGLVMSVNDTDTDEGAQDVITAFHNTAITGKYRLDVDVYLGIDSDGGTTEFAHVGVAGDNPATDFNSLFLDTAGSGHYLAFNGDGDSSSDWRHSTPSTFAVPSGDPSYLNNDGVNPNSTNGLVPFYQELLPAPEFQFPGSPGNSWIELTVTVADTVTYWVNGTPIINTPAEATDGLVSLGYADLFSSVGGQFVVYDNLSVTAIPEPTSALLALAGLAVLARRRQG